MHSYWKWQSQPEIQHIPIPNKLIPHHLDPKIVRESILKTLETPFAVRNVRFNPNRLITSTDGSAESPILGGIPAALLFAQIRAISSSNFLYKQFSFMSAKFIHDNSQCKQRTLNAEPYEQNAVFGKHRHFRLPTKDLPIGLPASIAPRTFFVITRRYYARLNLDI